MLAYGAASTLLARGAPSFVLTYGTASTLLAPTAPSLMLAYGAASTLLALTATAIVLVYGATKRVRSQCKGCGGSAICEQKRRRVMLYQFLV